MSLTTPARLLGIRNLSFEIVGKKIFDASTSRWSIVKSTPP
jgi:hypothetical protein